jgi:uncharacterized protein involved in outer membrane biogenesis
VIVIAGLAYVASGAFLKPNMEKLASRMVGAKVELGSVSLQPFSGTLTIKDIKVQNPEGFRAGPAAEVKELKIDTASPISLFRHIAVIDHIIVTEPRIFFELGFNGNNLYALQRNAQRYSGSVVENSSSSPEKRVVIRELSLVQPKLQLAPPDLIANPASKPVELPIKDVTINNIGDPNQPANIAGAIASVISAVIVKLPLTDRTMMKDTLGSMKSTLDNAAGALKGALGQ